MGIIENSITLRSSLKEVTQAHQWIAENARQAGFSDAEISDLQVVISEAFANAVKHSYRMEDNHDIVLSVVISPENIVLTVRDFGNKINLDHYQSPDLNVASEGGYGIFLMRSLMDSVEFDISRGLGTELRMTKYRQGAKKDD